jgi:betaine lipid synthase
MGHQADLFQTENRFEQNLMDSFCSHKLLTMTGQHPVIAGFTTIIFSVLAVIIYKAQNVSRLVQFAWCCFLKPVRGSSQSENLDSFYTAQADIYDATRTALLKGRETMLQLAAAELKARYEITPTSPTMMKRPRIWVDMGGGTGEHG